MKKEVEIEIDKDLKTRMVRRAQQVDLRVASKHGESERIVRSMKEIGLAFQQDRSEECHTKVYTILNEDFRIRSGYERTIETILMRRLKIEYTDAENTAKGSIARMVVKRKCNIAKSLNKRTQKTHQGKVRIKRNKEEVSALPLRDAEQAFTVGKNKWYTIDGKEYEPTGSAKTKRNNYYLNRIQKLEEEV